MSRYTQIDTRDGRVAGENESDDEPLGAVQAAEVRDLLTYLRRNGMDDLYEVAESLSLEHERAVGSERRLLRLREADDDRLREAEQKAKLVDKLFKDDSDLVLFDRRQQRVRGREDIDTLVQGREPLREVEQQVQQHVSLLGGGELE